MLADPRSESLSTRFAGEWLRLAELQDVIPDALLYPNFDRTLAQAMRRETELVFDSIVREDRNVLDLLTANYTFVNERLAVHYDCSLSALVDRMAGAAERHVEAQLSGKALTQYRQASEDTT